MPMNKIHVSVADWQKDIAEIRRIRETVFIAEQAVPPELEWDADDATAVHFLAFEGDSQVYWFEGNYTDYEENKKKRLGDLEPKRIRYKKLV